MRSNRLKKRTIVLIICAALLLSELIFLGVFHFAKEDEEILSNVTEAPTEATEAPTEATEEVTEAPTEEPTEAPTEEPAEEATEPSEGEAEDDNRYVLTFAGDCTFGSTSSNWNNGSYFVKTVGTNYDWPFDNVREFFEEDDFTMINLEGPLTDSTTGAAGKRFAFRGPTAYTKIMTGSSVEAVTLANNHSADYGKTGYSSTKTALEDAGVTYVEENKTAIFKTESGLTIGLYADSFEFSASSIRTNISNLKSKGAEIIVCAFHWGSEGHYRPSNSQQAFARVAIDAGADIVYGHHPHVLQKIEKYGDGIIYYSLGNFSFGGAANPQDYDSAFVQQEIIRNEDGSVSLGELTIVPVSISSVSGKNNYQPKLLEKGSKAYDRVMSKLDGSFTGPNLNVDYSKLDGDTATEPPATEPPATNPPAVKPPVVNPPATEPPAVNPPATEAPPSSGGSTDSGSTGGSTGGSTDSGSSGGSTGGSTDSGSSGGSTGGSTDSGSTGGSTGGSTDSGSTGGSTGGSTDSGSTGGSTGGSTDSGSTGGSSDAGSGASTDSGSSGSSGDSGSSGGSSDSGSGASADSGSTEG